ncbi:MAG TPA: DMT family protein [Caulobacteraceae bacterium]|nr:DMT family protein [Caulobacteraceae bacterium]
MRLLPILLLVCSNVFMTVAWYGHLKFTSRPLWLVVVASWAIAFCEYCFAVPANRIGFEHGYSLGQLKVIQEVVTLVVFAVFAAVVMGEKLKWNHAAAFVCLVAAVGFVFFDKLKAAV